MKFLNKWFFYKLIILALFGCAQVTGINLRKHQFSQKPEKIIWFQIAGLHEEHFSWIYFDPDEKLNSYNQFLCFGKAWNYTMKDLRHDSTVGFRVQDTAKMNITGECEDFSHKPIWSYLKEKGYASGILEIASNSKNSLQQVKKCDKDPYLRDAHVWISRDQLKESDRSFHADLKENYQTDRFYFDKSCFKGECVSNRIQNVERLYNWIKDKKDKHLFIVKEYGYEQALKSRDFQKAKKILREYNVLIESFLPKTIDSNTLFIVTGTSSIGVEIPGKGMDLKAFLDKGLKANYRDTMLLSPVLASGARSENFCGMFNESELMKRIFSEPAQSKKKYIFVNPFEGF